MSDLSSEFFCCEYSVQVGEQLFATATRADVWLALEYTLPWGKDAFVESSLPETVKQRINAYLASIPKSRLQFIRQPAGGSATGFAFYIAVSDELKPRLYSIHLDSFEALLTLDVPAIASGDPAYDQYLSQEPLFLVCANGKRDISCAKYGRPVYEAMSSIVGKSVWQCTHIGGHRFAATLVCLPHGISYGRVPPGKVQTLVNEFQQNRLYIEAYRGRSCYDEAVQAADYFLRQRTGIREFNAFRVRISEKTGNEWTISFEAISSGSIHTVHLSEYVSEFPILKNSNDAKGTPGVQFRLNDIQSR